jgi:DNA-binding response OmpR family regulator
MYNILICDDERDIVSALKIYLGSENYNIYEAYNGREALDILASKEIHLVLLDIMMPVLDGISALSYLRESSNVPVILLSAKSEDTDKILGLNIGADDYITKPFNPLEVKGRIKAIIRRASRGRIAAAPQENVIEVGDLNMDLDNRRVTLDGREVNLTSKEFELLELLATHAGKVYSRAQLLQMIWGKDNPGDVRTVDVHIRRLREKIESNASEPRYVQTKWGVGYYFRSHEK